MRSESALREEVTEPPSEAAEQIVSHPPGFELAARAEHQNEAAAIRLMADSVRRPFPCGEFLGDLMQMPLDLKVPA